MGGLGTNGLQFVPENHMYAPWHYNMCNVQRGHDFLEMIVKAPS